MEILRSTAGIFGIRGDKNNLNETERRFYREAFNNFDWNGNGKISYGSLLPAMRRVGVNPTEVEVHDLINKIDDGTGVLTFEDFCSILQEKNKEFDSEQHYKETFRVFSKDDEGCIPAEELAFVLAHHPRQISQKEIEEMIKIVDKNGDGKISYSEFRVMMGAFPLLMPEN